jgi:hypothetical protein
MQCPSACLCLYAAVKLSYFSYFQIVDAKQKRPYQRQSILNALELYHSEEVKFVICGDKRLSALPSGACKACGQHLQAGAEAFHEHALVKHGVNGIQVMTQPLLRFSQEFHELLPTFSSFSDCSTPRMVGLALAWSSVTFALKDLRSVFTVPIIWPVISSPGIHKRRWQTTRKPPCQV